MVISKEDALSKTRPKPKVNVKLRWISLFSKSSPIKTTASGLSYELGVNGEKKVNGNWILLIKIDIAHFTLVNLENLSLKPLIHGQINLTHFLNQKLYHQTRCLHDQISLKETNQISFKEKDPFQLVGATQPRSTFFAV